jgi:pyruvate kinase
MPKRFTRRVLRRHISEMEHLRDAALSSEHAFAQDIERVHSDWRSAARNFAHYLALRNRDLRDLQRSLSALGLSSLGRAEAHTLATIQAVLAALTRIGEQADKSPLELPVALPVDSTGIDAHTRALLGPRPADRPTHVMVTMPSEAADDPALVRALVEAGMDCARINCAHDGPAVWKRIAKHTRAAARALGRPCRVMVDLPGPKLRTAPFPEGPRVLHVKPERGLRGEVVRPARLLLVSEDRSPSSRDVPEHDARVPIEGAAFVRAVVRDVLALRDVRGRRRRLEIVAIGTDWRLAELSDGAWIESGSAVSLERAGVRLATARIGTLPAAEERLHLHSGDMLWVMSHDVPARAASTLGPARVGCTLPEVFRDARAGEPIHFDDGKIGGVIRAVVNEGSDAPRLEVELVSCAPGGSRLGGDKGINLPNTRLVLPALTVAEREVLRHVARYADIVALSFVHDPEDVLELESRLDALGRGDIGIVLKIETARAFQNLPRLILAGLRSKSLGVMVARGDLGVELGFERLAEVQEEILWLCEAAHVPVIWATQVLENLTKHGQPSRAEVTDAAMSARAECVMLNKGPYVLDAVHFLVDVLRRMQDHQQKKFSMLRKLSVCGLADALPALAPAARAEPDGEPDAAADHLAGLKGAISSLAP